MNTTRSPRFAISWLLVHAQVRAAALDADLEARRARRALASAIGSESASSTRCSRSPAANAKRVPNGISPGARADEVGHVGRIRDALEAEAPCGVGAALAQARAAVGGQRIEQHVGVRDRVGPRRVHEPADHGRGSGRHVGRAAARPGWPSCASAAAAKQSSERTARRAPRAARFIGAPGAATSRRACRARTRRRRSRSSSRADCGRP